MGHTQDLILKSMENLTINELRKFKLKLFPHPLWDGFDCMPRGAQLPLDALDFTNKTVNLYLEDYGLESAEVLRELGELEEAVSLQETVKSASGCVSDGNVAQSTPVPAPTSTPSVPSVLYPPWIHFGDKYWTDFLNCVIQLDPVLDKLYGNVLSKEQYQEVRAEDINLDKMRKLCSFMADWYLSHKDLFLKALRET
ncbi:apoptosis-associated speck-like protein containing a CARD [Vombatus ursinus]|uniref:Pyrin domain-containing protein n=1 Tax=Vombatus ursinus TaxID=29139 RepID=A0A4X2KSP9_VOMUR|nr:apoptosis-associated speck-like protein containing a CARD [Vombatus ursinus]